MGYRPVISILTYYFKGLAMREYKCLICGYSRKGQYAHNAMILHVKKHTDKHGNKIKQPVEGKHYIKIADSASHPAGKFTHKYECLFEGCDAVYGGENKKQTLQAIKTHIQRGHKSPAIEGENFKKSRKKPNRIAGAVHKKVKEQIKRARRKDSS